MRIQFMVLLALSAFQLWAMNTIWQQATISDSGAMVSVTGFDVAPQLGLILVLQFLAIFGVRYWKPLLGRVAITVTFTLSGLVIWSAFAEVFSSRHWLESVIAAKTGIADWGSQLGSITHLQTNWVGAVLAVVATTGIVLWSLRSLTVKRAAKETKNSESDWLD